MSSLDRNFEYMAAFPVMERAHVDACCAGSEGFEEVEHLYARIELLAQAAAYEGLENYVRGPAGKDEPFRYHDLIQRGIFTERTRCDLERLRRLDLIPTFTAQGMTRLPIGSFAIQFAFVLEKPWFSRDDVAFYPIDNPVRKDKVFRLPAMSATSWKGLLRWAGRMEKGLLAHLETDPDMAQWKDHDQTVRLFGTEKGGRDTWQFRQGYLMTYPTFFDQVSLEVINPHSRYTRAGTNPILYEVVPAGASGTFSLLYVPFDQIGGDMGECYTTMKEDFRLLGKALFALMCRYGLSAKRTAGWGMAADRVAEGTSGKVWIQNGTMHTFQVLSDLSTLI